MKTAAQAIRFQKAVDNVLPDPLKEAWQKSLIAPQDGMWDALTDMAAHWLLLIGDDPVGYAAVDAENRLLQFFVQPIWLPEAPVLFRQFIQQEKIKKALAGTNNPIFFSVAMQVQKAAVTHTLLFSNHLDVPLSDQPGTFGPAKSSDLDRLVDFCHLSMGAPKRWLQGYIGNLIDRGEIFYLEDQSEVLGTCEVRKSDSQPDYADIGMVVSPAHRRKGLGSFLLGKAKSLALQWGRQPICSCEAGNIGSLKSIHNNGFRSLHQMVAMEF